MKIGMFGSKTKEETVQVPASSEYRMLNVTLGPTPSSLLFIDSNYVAKTLPMLHERLLHINAAHIP